MAKHKREPIEHTCPEIDRYIKSIKWELFKERDLKCMDQQELFEAACSMSSELEACIGYLEELRESNSTLREWGISEANRVDELEKEFQEPNF